MARTTSAEVSQLLNSIDMSIDCTLLSVWIEVASKVVDDNEDCIQGTDDQLTTIEKLLAAHFGVLSGGGDNSNVVSEKADVLSASYDKASIANSINETVFGKAANAMSGGCLADYDKESFSLYSLGGDCDEWD